ncbi:MAG: cytochrome C oxidase assembly protein [Pseudomonadota bacterium]
MSIRVEHELHGRRRGRNVGVGLMLASFVVLIMALTFVKITDIDFARAPGTANTAVGSDGSTD